MVNLKLSLNEYKDFEKKYEAEIDFLDDIQLRIFTDGIQSEGLQFYLIPAFRKKRKIIQELLKSSI